VPREASISAIPSKRPETEFNNQKSEILKFLLLSLSHLLFFFVLF
jgi:hypothetical protein